MLIQTVRFITLVLLLLIGQACFSETVNPSRDLNSQIISDFVWTEYIDDARYFGSDWFGGAPLTRNELAAKYTRYDFYQGGYSFGAITGHFIAADINQDQLVSFDLDYGDEYIRLRESQYEIIDFETNIYQDFYRLKYHLDTGHFETSGFTDSNGGTDRSHGINSTTGGVINLNSSIIYNDPQIVFERSTQPVILSIQPNHRVIPLPASIWLLCSGLLILFRIKKKIIPKSLTCR